jgi:hypothetical protein
MSVGESQKMTEDQIRRLKVPGSAGIALPGWCGAILGRPVRRGGHSGGGFARRR